MIKSLAFIAIVFIAGCDNLGLSSSGVSSKLIIDGSEKFEAQAANALKRYRPKCVYKVKESKAPSSYYVDGIAYTRYHTDLDIMAGVIAHEDYHCFDPVNFNPDIETADQYRTDAELRAFEYQAKVLESLGRNDLAAAARAADGQHWRNTSHDDKY